MTFHRHKSLLLYKVAIERMLVTEILPVAYLQNESLLLSCFELLAGLDQPYMWTTESRSILDEHLDLKYLPRWDLGMTYKLEVCQSLKH